MFVAFSGSRDARDLGAGPFGQIFYTALAKQPSVATACQFGQLVNRTPFTKPAVNDLPLFAIRTEIEKVGPVILANYHGTPFSLQ